MGGTANGVARDGDSYTFDYSLNEMELSGNTTLYRVNTAGGGVSGNVTFNPDLSTRTINPQAFIASVPMYAWLIIAAVFGVGIYLARRQ